MAKRKNDPEGCAYLVILAAIVGGIYYVVQNLWLLIPLTLFAVMLLSVGVVNYKKQAREERIAAFEAEQAEKHRQQEVTERQREAQEERRRWLEENERRARRELKAIEHRKQQERLWFEAEVKRIAKVDRSLGQLRYMSGAEFENFMADFLEGQGYKVEHLAGVGDQGVDLILTDGDKRIAVQLKQYARPLGNKPIQEVFAGRFIHGVDEAWVITTSSFTKGGFEAARKTQVRLIDGEELFAWIQEASEEM